MVSVPILLYVFVAFVAAAALLSLFIGTMRLFRPSHEIIGELVKWALVIVVIVLAFIGMAYLIIVFT